MGNLKQKIQNDLVGSLKAKEELTCSTLRILLAAILTREKEKRYKVSKEQKEAKEEELIEKSQLIDEEIIDVIASEIKKRKDSVAAYEMGKREDLAKREKAEIEILQKYLPEQMLEEEVKKLIQETIQKIGASSIKDMGRVMAELMPKIKGKADGSLVSKIVKELLG